MKEKQTVFVKEKDTVSRVEIPAGDTKEEKRLCNGLRRAVTGGVRSYVKRRGGPVTAELDVRQRGRYTCLFWQICSEGQTGGFCVMLREGKLWKPAKKEKEKMKSEIKRLVLRGISMNAAFFADAPIRAEKYFRSALVGMDKTGRLFVYYPKNILSTKAKSFALWNLGDE